MGKNRSIRTITEAVPSLPAPSIALAVPHIRLPAPDWTNATGSTDCPSPSQLTETVTGLASVTVGTITDAISTLGEIGRLNPIKLTDGAVESRMMVCCQEAPFPARSLNCRSREYTPSAIDRVGTKASAKRLPLTDALHRTVLPVVSRSVPVTSSLNPSIIGTREVIDTPPGILAVVTTGGTVSALMVTVYSED